ncbi:MAG: 50S ribosome-binding GTPase [archaeon]|nr:50S ribosome-binding GTPase [archaeon]
MAIKSYRVPTVLSSDELKDKAFCRASKIAINGASALDSKKKTSIAKIAASGDIVKDSLTEYINRFPRIEKDDDFFPELIDLVIGIDQYKKSLGAINWAAKKIEKIKIESLRNVRRSKDIFAINCIRNSFYGRMSSVIDQVEKDLLFLRESKNKFRVMPFIDPKIATVVVAGFPNVGKSRLVTYLSTAAPEVAPYPFTTKGIVVGHIEDGWKKFQVIDTPGLLDREFEDRNNIEKQAVLALRYLTHVILFVLDPSETCGYSIEKQETLLKSVINGFKNVPVITAESKNDILVRKNGNINFSAETGSNLEKLRDAILAELRKVKFEDIEIER